MLREQQIKQVERITAKQELGLVRLDEESRREERARELKFTAEEAALRKEWDIRKKRMLWRWKVNEAVERRKLELEKGVCFGELPDVQWGDDEKSFELEPARI